MGVGATFLTSESFDKPELINVLKDSIVKISPNDKIILETIISNFEKDDFSLITPQQIHFLKKKGIRTSLFIEPKIQDIKKTKELGAGCVELHTGKLCNLFNLNKNFTIQELVNLSNLNIK